MADIIVTVDLLYIYICFSKSAFSSHANIAELIIAVTKTFNKKKSALTSSFSSLFHAILIYVQCEQHVRVPVFFFAGIGVLSAMASSYGCIKEPGGFLWGRRSQFRLVLEL